MLQLIEYNKIPRFKLDADVENDYLCIMKFNCEVTGKRILLNRPSIKRRELQFLKPSLEKPLNEFRSLATFHSHFFP
jgi:hypothetical protein